MNDKQIRALARQELRALDNLVHQAKMGHSIPASRFDWWIGDIANLYKMYLWIQQGQFGKASEYMESLDTEAYDRLNQKIVDYVQKD